jgi:histone acetyltransferase (RNA polymerase elongator complex component)
MKKPFIIPVFLPRAGCPHRCIYCRPETLTGRKRPGISDTELRAGIEAFLRYRTTRRGNTEIAFFGGNFLGQPLQTIHRLLSVAEEYVRTGRAGGIRFSTRPDSVTPTRLLEVSEYSVTTVELGVQSMDDAVLEQARRGYRAKDVAAAVSLLKNAGVSAGVQLMPGLPGDTPRRSSASTGAVIRAAPDFVRIYPTLVLHGTALADLYTTGRFVPLSLTAAVDRAKEMVLRFSAASIPVIRLGLQASTDLRPGDTVLAGPYHSAFGHLVYAALMRDRAEALIAALSPAPPALTMTVHPAVESRLRGEKNQNLEYLSKRFPAIRIRIAADKTISDDTIHLKPSTRYAG